MTDYVDPDLLRIAVAVCAVIGLIVAGSVGKAIVAQDRSIPAVLGGVAVALAILYVSYSLLMAGYYGY
jgi:hypothetical protein